MGKEFELKFAASGEQQDAIRQTIGGCFTSISMETTYYDTPSGALSALRYTLRRRLENGVSICTVKTPIDETGRGEWEWACQDIAESIPVLCKLGAPGSLAVLAQEGLVPICGARFTRLAQTVELDGAEAELALDSGVLMGGGRELPFREVEVELKSGSEAAVILYARQLSESFGLKIEGRSKFRRALELAKGENNG